MKYLEGENWLGIALCCWLHWTWSDWSLRFELEPHRDI